MHRRNKDVNKLSSITQGVTRYHQIHVSITHYHQTHPMPIPRLIQAHATSASITSSSSYPLVQFSVPVRLLLALCNVQSNRRRVIILKVPKRGTPAVCIRNLKRNSLSSRAIKRRNHIAVTRRNHRRSKVLLLAWLVVECGALTSRTV